MHTCADLRPRYQKRIAGGMISHTCDTAHVFTKVIEVENWVPNLGVSSREVVIYCD